MSEKESKVIVTDQHFEEFKDGFNHYVERFGLKDYKIYFEQVDSDEFYGSIDADPRNGIATIKLCKEIDARDINDFVPYETGKHEAIHLLLARIEWIGSCRYVESGEISTEVERLVRILEKNL